MTGWFRRLTGQGVPAEFAGVLDEAENVLAVAEVEGGGHLLASSLGLWLPSGDGLRRVGWHLVSKAVWRDGALSVTEAEELGAAGEAVLIADLPARRFELPQPGTLPRVVHGRVTSSILSRHHHDLPGGGVWFVQRRVPGAEAPVLQARADPGTEPPAVLRLATEVARRIGEVP